MWARATSNEPLAKALRIALVFSLVFGISFRVEWLAYAATVAEVDTAAEHANDELTGLAVYQLETVGDIVQTGNVLGSVPAGGEPATLKLTAGETVQIAAIASWQEKQTEPEPTEPEDPTPGGDENPDDNPGGNSGESQGSGGSGGAGTDDQPGGTNDEDDKKDDITDNNDDDPTPVDETNLDEQSLSTQSSDSAQAATQARGIPSHGLQTQDDDYARLANFLQWDYANNDGVNAIESVNANPATGAVSVQGGAEGTATITCTLPADAGVQAADGLAGAQIEIPVEVVSKPYVSSIEIFHDGDTALSPTEPTTLIDAERESYAVHVRVTTNSAGQTKTYDLLADASFKDESEGAFENLEWKVLDADENEVGDDVATIETKGGGATLVLKGDGPVIVRCSTPNVLPNSTRSWDFIAQSENVKKDEKPEDIQGDSHPQDTLTVTVNDPYAKADDDSASEGDGSSKSSASADKEASSGAAAKTGKTTSTAFVANADSSLVPVDSESGQQGEPLGAMTDTYTMTIPDGETTTVEGRGSNLAMLLDRAGVGAEEQKRVESIDFISAELGTTNVAWSDLVDVSRDYIIIAPKSYVQELNGKSAQAASSGEGEDAGGNESGESSVGTQAEDGEDDEADGETGGESGDESTSPEDEPVSTPETPEADPSQGSSGSASTGLLENTKYRILYNGSLGTANPLSLRYINQIVVNMGEPEQDKTDPELSISIDYKPVPRGAEAFLSAVPNNKVGASRFGYTWEISTDGGKTWSVYSDQSVQTLRIMTEDPPYGHIGHLFRVILETDLLDDDGNPRGATSDPVTITASDDFTVALDYVPPLAGDTANFEAHPYNLDSGDKVTSWVWEANMGDGWQPIPGATNAPSWSTPTNAVEESDDDSGDDDAAAIMTYVRVRATTEKGKTATSNEQPLTVRVGEADTGPKASDLAEALNNTKSGDNFKETPDPNTNPNDNTDAEPTTAPGNYTVQETDVVFDDTQGALSERLYGEDATDPTVAGDSPTIVVNDNVSKQIKDQQQAAQQQKESTTPGARWTKLNTMNPTNDDLQRILADNPFAPFAMPLGLGVVAAGGLEKLLTFRREL